MRKTLAIVASGFLALFGGFATRAHAATQTAMINCSGLPCINVSLAEGKTVRLLLDTGNTTSTLDLKQAQELGLALEPTRLMKEKKSPTISSPKSQAPSWAISPSRRSRFWSSI